MRSEIIVMLELKNKNNVNQNLRSSTENFENVKRYLIFNSSLISTTLDLKFSQTYTFELQLSKKIHLLINISLKFK